MTYDFCGYATRSNVKCSDGRTIMPDAFRDDDGKKVPLVWNHQHNSPDNVLGHAILENRPDGVYAYATFNNNDVGQRAKELVRHGDISALSIYANKLKETAGKVMHGVIREVSLVMAGANPEALIDSFVAHSDGNVYEDREQGQFYSGMDGELYHADPEDEDDAEDKENKAEESDEEAAEMENRQKRLEKMKELRKRALENLQEKNASAENEEEADEAPDDSDEDADTADDENDEEEDKDQKVKHADSDDSDEEKTVRDILDTLTDKQKAVVMVMLKSAMEAAGKKEKPEVETSEEDKESEEKDEDKDQEAAHADSKDEEANPDDETVGDILDSFTDKQKVVVMALLENALEAAKENKSEKDDEDNEEEPEMKHNLFDKETGNENVLSHSDEMKILEMAKDSSIGTLKGAMKAFCDNAELAHGFDSQSLSILFPEYQDVKPGAPEMLTTDQGWITKVLEKVHKIPMTKVRVRFADIRDIENLRAKGFKKGTQKALAGDVAALYRVADAQTVYVRSDLSRDDILDMTDFDYVAYMYGVDKMLLNEELATAIMLGDGRAVSDQYKIKEDRIIPIWTDDELFTIHATVDQAAAKTKLQGSGTGTYFGDNFVYAEAFIEALMDARVSAKNSGQADLYIAPKALNKMLLARDRNGRRIYNTLEELRSAMNVREIITAEQFEGKTRTVTETVDDPQNEGQTITRTVTKQLLGILTKMENYDLGANKGGEITHFTDFDLDFNKEKSLLETRVSGMQVRPLASVVLEEVVTE